VNQNDIALATGGITAPLWLPALNQWVALVVGIMSICYLGFKIYQMWRDTNGKK